MLVISHTDVRSRWLYRTVEWDSVEQFNKKWLPQCRPVIKGIYLSIYNTPENWSCSEYQPSMDCYSKSLLKYLEKKNVEYPIVWLNRQQPYIKLTISNHGETVKVTLVDEICQTVSFPERVAIIKAMIDWKATQENKMIDSAIDSTIKLLQDELVPKTTT